MYSRFVPRFVIVSIILCIPLFAHSDDFSPDLTLLGSGAFQDAESQEKLELPARKRWFFRRQEDDCNLICGYSLVSIPKSGTHLVIKAMQLIGGGIPAWHHGLDPDIYANTTIFSRRPYFTVTHFWQSPQVEKVYRESKQKRIVCIRDLRDVCVSTLNHILKWAYPGYDEKYPNVLNYLKTLSYDDQLLFVINYEYSTERTSEKWQVSLPLVAAQAIAYYNDPSVYVCRYENLVGEEGGGKKSAQLTELRGLANFMNCQKSDKELRDIAKLLYGDDFNPFGTRNYRSEGSTFQKGKIGTWQAVFKEQHKEAFKRKFGDALIELGYEADYDW